MRVPGFFRQVVVLLGMLLVAEVGHAHSLPAPEGPVLLKMSGDIDNANVGNQLWLDRQMLEQLEGRELTTDTPWHRQASRFKGPLLRSVLELAGVRAGHIRVHALNGFVADIPVSDAQRYDVILAMSQDDNVMSVRNFGPLFVLYPFDDHPELHNETIQFRSVWQVDAIEVP
ncbi:MULTISPECIES: molybdopterin-dependent oxidoreductase [unclassified Halomonas]|uniref:molybdopterin-dependent oxidoreductase n=1 Tax=unclassified Halomonas TaxID=2609666 RepID=UPI001C98292B|nr:MULTISPECIES: molybdopterin-dependent oxidoreductase [unclassified Halomonas]MBY5923935.1 molybdopterin-dependent oxidoreductase [Halomonas sp. DP4Y7-2]MBY6230977.1 molybdopterin-dependent oxidoreductase [Halomonas sp. DP4Y7-1]